MSEPLSNFRKIQGLRSSSCTLPSIYSTNGLFARKINLNFIYRYNIYSNNKVRCMIIHSPIFIEIFNDFRNFWNNDITLDSVITSCLEYNAVLQKKCILNDKGRYAFVHLQALYSFINVEINAESK